MRGLNPKQLKRRRTALNLTQAALALKLGVTPNTVARWERGLVPLPPMLSLALTAITGSENKA